MAGAVNQLAGNSEDAPDESAADQPAAATEPADEDQALPVEANLAGETVPALTQASSTDAEPGDAPVVAEAAQAVPATERPDGGDDTGDDTGGDPAGVEPTADDPDRILHVDPAELIIGANVRVDPRLDKEFLASIKADGVEEVITVYRNQERDLVVIKGQRRAAGAVAVGTPTGTVPVRVLPQPGDAERIVTQLVENIHRADMTRQETTDGFAQLSLLGMKAATIVRRTGVKKTTVDKHLAVARAAAVRQVADLLTLDQAAAMVEFDDDPQVMAALRDAAQAGQVRPRPAERPVPAGQPPGARHARRRPDPGRYPDRRPAPPRRRRDPAEQPRRLRRGEAGRARDDLPGPCRVPRAGLGDPR